MSDGHRQTVWARVLISSLADAGVRQVIVSPGSRSTPFAAAAASHGELHCRHLLDERAAAFFALGQARVTGRPSLLICTSGTAVANYFPAVVEAGVDHVPLLVLSADRPVELSHSGANQTIDQIKLFGDHARAFYDLGLADGSTRALRALRRQAAQAVAESLGPTPGAVHLNARARKPLEPSEAADGEESRVATRAERLLNRPIVQVHAPVRRPDNRTIDRLASSCRKHEEGLIVCGPAAISQHRLRSRILRLGRRYGYPVLSETTSQVRFRATLEEFGDAEAVAVDAFAVLLKSARFRAAFTPRLVLQIGRTPTAASWEPFLDARIGRLEHWVLAEQGWHDPASSATDLIRADLEPTLERLLEASAGTPRTSGWLSAWKAAEDVAWHTIDRTRSSLDFGEARAVQAAIDAVPDQGLLAVGNSLAVRQTDLWSRGSQRDVWVWSQRGASGIDGNISGVCGAVTEARRPGVLLIGDVSFLHDLSGLIAAKEVDTPLVIVVIQNQGGRIFEHLPWAKHPDAAAMFDLWTTPHEASFGAAAGVHKLPFRRATNRVELATALAEGLRHGGVSVVEAVVPPSSARRENTAMFERVREAIGRWLETEPLA